MRFGITRRAALGGLLTLAPGSGHAQPAEGGADNAPDWFYPAWAATASYSKPILVRDTDSAVGRYSLKTKELGLKDLARVHGHMCDGLVIAFVEIKAALEKLFPDGVVDRTDLRAVSKNGPCWVDAVMMMTGARINFQTLRIDNSVGDGFIVQRISTGDAWEVRLKLGVFPEEQAAVEERIRALRAQGQPAAAKDIDAVEELAATTSRRLLTTPPAELLQLKSLPRYKFSPTDLLGDRSDTINKSMPR